VAELGSALAAAAGVLAKIGLDIVLLAQTEVGEVTEAESGGSSALPQKRNPVGATLARACERRVRANAGVLLESLVGEHERAAGAWHAEWGALSEALAYTGGAATAIHRSLDGLEVDTERMRANLDLTHGAIAAERLVVMLADTLGRTEAHELVRTASLRSVAEGISLADAVSAGTDALTPEQIAAALDPATYLGSAGAFVDRALALVEAPA
jgi:3-carboxy-cis,cis-muconate cycloisomerase